MKTLGALATAAAVVAFIVWWQPERSSPKPPPDRLRVGPFFIDPIVVEKLEAEFKRIWQEEYAA